MIQFEASSVDVEVEKVNKNVVNLPLVRMKGTDERVTVDWLATVPSEAECLLLTCCGTVVFNDEEACAPVSIELDRELVNKCSQTVLIKIELVDVHHGASLSQNRVCELRILPGEPDSSFEA